MRTQEFNSKLISLLPLDEVPLHVHPFAARAPCDSKGSEWAAKEKPTPISQIFFSTCCAYPPSVSRDRAGANPAAPPHAKAHLGTLQLRKFRHGGIPSLALLHQNSTRLNS